MAQLDIWMYIVSIFFENSYMYKYQVEMCSVDGVINERERERVSWLMSLVSSFK